MSLLEKFQAFGLNEQAAKEAAANKRVAPALDDIFSHAEKAAGDRKKATLLHGLAADTKGADFPHRQWVIDAVADGRLGSPAQVSAAAKYLQKTADASVDGMEKASGVGLEVSEEETRTIIGAWLDGMRDDVETKRYAFLPKVLGEVRKLEQLKWAKPGLFKPIIDEYFLAVCGAKDERDVVKKDKKKAVKKTQDEPERSMFSEGFLGDLHKPGENPQKYPELMAAHLKATGGKVFTRFPPEPNGYLHIGHSKAIMVNFGYAQHHGGNCYLRFDDTNPEAEEEKFFVQIEDTIRWLGYKPWKITYSSDYFQQLYDLAEQLIQDGRAYVDHSTPEEVKQQRGVKADGTPGGDRFPSPWRDRSVEENLTEFRKMRDGHYEVGKAFLRMKQVIESPNPQMWDLVAYRVLDKPHHRTGDKWKIYPTYDFTHCLVDSFENISHSLCTTEFRLSRESYEWLCDELKVYRPAQREYGRLNLTGTIMSKRKIAKLVTENHVRDWDDPRLYTLAAIKRRGVPPGAILSFINTLGVTTSTTNIQIVRFESAIRAYLDATTPRLMVILDPVEVEIEGLDQDLAVEMPYKNDSPELGGRKLTFGKSIYIDREDFREHDSQEFFRLTPNQPVGLMKVPFNIKFKRVEKDADGTIRKLVCVYDHGNKEKPKTYIQWLPKNEVKVIDQIRIYNQLFKSENPSAHPDGFLADINPDSEIVVKGALVEQAFDHIQAKSPLNIAIKNSKFNIKEDAGPQTVRFQGLRVGYFCVDKDTTSDKLILNRIVTLKEDANK